jgi:hypothetical protein
MNVIKINYLIKNFIDPRHRADLKEESIQGIIFNECIISQIVVNVYDIYKNLTTLHFNNCQFKNKVLRAFLKEFGSLKELSIINCDIGQEIPAMMLTYMKNLEILILNGSKINNIHDKFLNPVRTTIKYVEFLKNPITECIFAVAPYANPNYQPRSIHKCKTIDELMELLEISSKRALERSNQRTSLHSSRTSLASYKSEDKPFVPKESVSQASKTIHLSNDDLLPSNISRDVKNYLACDQFKDFEIRIEDKSFKVHKFILAARSSVLGKMISENPDADSLNLIDIPIDIVQVLLNFIYYDKMPVPRDQNMLKDVFIASGRLKLTELHKFSSKNLMVKNDNAIEMLKLANKFQDLELRARSFEEVKKIFSGKAIKNEMADNPEELEKLLEAKNQMEEEMRKVQERFNKMFE